jgi:hypothetical protein
VFVLESEFRARDAERKLGTASDVATESWALTERMNAVRSAPRSTHELNNAKIPEMKGYSDQRDPKSNPTIGMKNHHSIMSAI